MIRILFICHGNICRSPMAEFVFKNMANAAGRADDFYIESAATSTEELGNPVYPPAKRIMAQYGVKCDGKFARQVRKADYDKFDLLICMDAYNIKNLMSIIGSDPEGKVHLLMEYANVDEPANVKTCCARDVADPWYTGDFEATWKDINEGCYGLMKCVNGDGSV